MKKSKLFPLVLALTLAGLTLSGCYRTHLVFDGGQIRDPDEASHRTKVAKIHRTFVLGLWELDGAIPVDAICPSGISYAYQRLGGWSWVVAFLSGGTVDARDIDMVCRDGSQATLRLVSKKTGT